jgi:hypothetical protein
MYDRILAEGILDGIELLGEVAYEDNVRSLARYLDFRAAGHDLPIVSNSDTHGREHTYGAYWTLVFVDERSAQGVLDAIAGGWSVACTTVGTQDREKRDSGLRAFGSFELVDYAYFLEQSFFGAHDALCAREAALAWRRWLGEAIPDERIAAYNTSMEALYDRAWAE